MIFIKLKLTGKIVYEKPKFTLFWGGPFSQWHPCKFYDGKTEYNCAEQYMMRHKALLFGDTESVERIMESIEPRTQKKLGRKVKGFNLDLWKERAREIVYQGNMLKFKQDDDLRHLLMETRGTELVEASPYDTIWGIGLSESDPRAQNKSEWQGLNWLGITLTKVRDDLYGQ